MRLERLFASLRTEHGTLATLEVLEFDALHGWELGRSRVLTAPPACKHLIGGEYPSLGAALRTTSTSSSTAPAGAITSSRT